MGQAKASDTACRAWRNVETGSYQRQHTGEQHTRQGHLQQAPTKTRTQQTPSVQTTPHGEWQSRPVAWQSGLSPLGPQPHSASPPGSGQHSWKRPPPPTRQNPRGIGLDSAWPASHCDHAEGGQTDGRTQSPVPVTSPMRHPCQKTNTRSSRAHSSEATEGRGVPAKGPSGVSREASGSDIPATLGLQTKPRTGASPDRKRHFDPGRIPGGSGRRRRVLAGRAEGGPSLSWLLGPCP